MVYIHRLGKAFCIHFNIESNQINVELLVCVKPSYIYNALIMQHMHKALRGPLTLHWKAGQESLATASERSRRRRSHREESLIFFFCLFLLTVPQNCTFFFKVSLLWKCIWWRETTGAIRAHPIALGVAGEEVRTEASKQSKRMSNVEIGNQGKGDAKEMQGDARRCKAKSVEMKA